LAVEETEYSYEEHPLHSLRTPQTTEMQMRSLIDEVIGQPWCPEPYRLSFPAPGQESLRVVTADGDGIVIKPTGAIWRSIDIG
jgi:hypothetical protein